MYRCNNCNEMFEEPDTKNIVAEEYLGVSHLLQGSTRLDINICPCCNDEDIEELEQCGICEEWFREEDLTDTTEMINGGCGYCCAQCIEDAEMIEM